MLTMGSYLIRNLIDFYDVCLFSRPVGALNFFIFVFIWSRIWFTKVLSLNTVFWGILYLSRPLFFSYWSILFLASIVIKVRGTCLSFSHRRLFLVFGDVFSLVLTVSVSHDLSFGFCSCGEAFSTKSLSGYWNLWRQWKSWRLGISSLP